MFILAVLLENAWLAVPASNMLSCEMFKWLEAEESAGVSMARICAWLLDCEPYDEAVELAAPMMLSMEKEGLLGAVVSVLRGGKLGKVGLSWG